MNVDQVMQWLGVAACTGVVVILWGALVLCGYLAYKELK